jgi:hypothetical protein
VEFAVGIWKSAAGDTSARGLGSPEISFGPVLDSFVKPITATGVSGAAEGLFLARILRCCVNFECNEIKVLLVYLRYVRDFKSSLDFMARDKWT